MSQRLQYGLGLLLAAAAGLLGNLSGTTQGYAPSAVDPTVQYLVGQLAQEKAERLACEARWEASR